MPTDVAFLNLAHPKSSVSPPKSVLCARFFDSLLFPGSSLNFYARVRYSRIIYVIHVLKVSVHQLPDLFGLSRFRISEIRISEGLLYMHNICDRLWEKGPLSVANDFSVQAFLVYVPTWNKKF